MPIYNNSYSFIAEDPADFDLFLNPSPRRRNALLL